MLYSLLLPLEDAFYLHYCSDGPLCVGILSTLGNLISISGIPLPLLGAIPQEKEGELDTLVLFLLSSSVLFSSQMHICIGLSNPS